MTEPAKWVYDDLDFDNRVTNLMWTISGNYDENMDAGEKSFISRDVALYQGITAGGRRKYINWDAVKRFIISRVKAGMDKDVLLGLIQMATDVLVEEKLMVERPGIYDIRKKPMMTFCPIISGCIPTIFLKRQDTRWCWKRLVKRLVWMWRQTA